MRREGDDISHSVPLECPPEDLQPYRPTCQFCNTVKVTGILRQNRPEYRRFPLFRYLGTTGLSTVSPLLTQPNWPHATIGNSQEFATVPLRGAS